MTSSLWRRHINIVDIYDAILHCIFIPMFVHIRSHMCASTHAHITCIPYCRLSFYSNLTAMCHESMRLSESTNLSFHKFCDTVFSVICLSPIRSLSADTQSVQLSENLRQLLFYRIYPTNQIAKCNWRLPRLIKFAPLYLTLYMTLYSSNSSNQRTHVYTEKIVFSKLAPTLYICYFVPNSIQDKGTYILICPYVHTHSYAIYSLCILLSLLYFRTLSNNCILTLYFWMLQVNK